MRGWLTRSQARYEVALKLWDTDSDRTNELMLDANFLFHGTWIEAYENTLAFFGMYLRKLARVTSNGVIDRKPKPQPKASAAAKLKEAAGRPYL